MKKGKKPKNAYDFNCPCCGCSQYLTPSIAMKCGINTGHGSCLKCKEFLHLEIKNKKKKTAKAEKWDNYLKRIKKEN